MVNPYTEDGRREMNKIEVGRIKFQADRSVQESQRQQSKACAKMKEADTASRRPQTGEQAGSSREWRLENWPRAIPRRATQTTLRKCCLYPNS